MTTSESHARNASCTSRIECTLHTDPRLIAAVAPIVASAAERAGLPQAARADLAAAAVETCLGMFPHSTADGKEADTIRVDVADFPDRVEVVIEGAGKTASATSTDGHHQPLQDLKVERTRCVVGDGRMHLTLIKQCGEAKSSQTA